MSGKGGDVIEVVTIRGKVVCVYINDQRVAGRKPYVTEGPVYHTLTAKNGEIRPHLKRKPRSKLEN